MISVDIDIHDKTTHFKHPEFYNELVRDQLERVVQFVILNKIPLSERLEDKVFLLETFLRLNGGRRNKRKKFKIIDSLVEDGILDELLQLQSFLFEEQDFNRWIIRSVQMNKKQYYGPKSNFSYMLFGEFIVADMLFMNYFDSENEDILNKFIAVLYRQKKANFDFKSGGDIREVFNSEFLDSRAILVRRLSSITKQSILFNYAGVRYWLTKKYPAVFGSDKKTDKRAIEFGNNRAGWMNIRRNLAGSVFKLEKVDNLLLSDVLAELNEKMDK